MSTVNLATPLRSTYRNPVAKLVQEQVNQRLELMADPLVDMATAKIVLGICESTLNKLISTGKLAIVRYTPRSHRKIRTSELRRFMNAGVQNGA